MLVKGKIVAYSHIFRLKSPGRSLILKFITKEGCIDVLIKDEEHFSWSDSILNGEMYELSGLRTCILTMGKSEVSMLMTTKESTLKKSDSASTTNEMKDNYILEDKSLITYKGKVTKILDKKLCIYELDNSVVLCTIYLKSAAQIPNLDVGDDVLIERTHLVQSAKERALLCCGLTSIKTKSSQNTTSEDNTINMLSNLICCLGIGYKSLQTFYSIISTLNSKLCPTLVSYKQLLHCEKYQNNLTTSNGLIAVLLNCSHLIEKSYLTSEFVYSALSEFVSCPHICLAMRSSCLQKDISFPLLETILHDSKKATFITLKTWKYSKLSSTHKNKKVLVGCLTCTDDGSFYLHDQSSAIPLTIIKTYTEICEEDKANLCPISHKGRTSNLNHLVAISTYEVVTEKSNLAESQPHIYILVKDSDIISLSEKQIQNKKNTLSEEKEQIVEISMYICQVFLPRKKSLPVLGDDEWKNQFIVEGVTISNVVVEMEDKDPAYEKDFDRLKFEDIFDSDEASNLPDFLERRKKDLLVSNESLTLYPFFDTGKAVLLKIPVKLAYGKSISEDINLAIRKYVNSNPLTLVKGAIIEPYGEAEKICPKHSSNSDHKVSKIKLVKEACFCSLVTKFQSIEEVAMHGEIYNPFDSIDVEGFIKEKWIVKNKEIKNDSDPPLQISLVLADKENTSVTLTLYITQSHPDWTLYGLLPGKFVRLCCVKVLKAQQSGSYYLKSAKRFGLDIVETDASIEDSVLNAAKSPSPLKYFLHVNDNQQFRSLSTIIRVLSVEILECVSQVSQIPPAKAKFILDDGSLQVTAHCTGVNVKHLLNISERQWQDLLSVASSERGGLHFNWWNVHKKGDKETNGKILLFRYLCSRSEIRRQVIAHCRAYSSSREADSLQKGQFRVFCISIEKVQPIDVSVELLRLLRK